MYELKLSNKARNELEKINDLEYSRISEKINSLEINPRQVGCIKLKGKNSYRIRIGNYRVLFEIDDKTKEVYIYKIALRKEAYR